MGSTTTGQELDTCRVWSIVREAKKEAPFSTSLHPIFRSPILGPMGNRILDIIEVIVLVLKAEKSIVEQFWKTDRHCPITNAKVHRVWSLPLDVV